MQFSFETVNLADFMPNDYLPLTPQTSPQSLCDSPPLPPQTHGPRKGSSSRRNPWGNYSYAELITRAIESSPDGRRTLSQIYDWVTRHIPHFRDKADTASSAGWKNSIRHNLSLHKKFVRERNTESGKSSWWKVDESAGEGRTTRRKPSPNANQRRRAKRNKTDATPASSAATAATQSRATTRGSTATTTSSSSTYQGGSTTYQGCSTIYQDRTSTYQGSTGTYQGIMSTFHGNNTTYQGSSGTYQGKCDTYGGNSVTYPDNSNIYQDNSGIYQSNTIAFQNNTNICQDNSSTYQGNNGTYQGNNSTYRNNNSNYQNNTSTYDNSSTYQGSSGTYQGNNSTAYTIPVVSTQKTTIKNALSTSYHKMTLVEKRNVFIETQKRWRTYSTSSDEYPTSDHSPGQFDIENLESPLSPINEERLSSQHNRKFLEVEKSWNNQQLDYNSQRGNKLLTSSSEPYTKRGNRYKENDYFGNDYAMNSSNSTDSPEIEITLKPNQPQNDFWARFYLQSRLVINDSSSSESDPKLYQKSCPELAENQQHSSIGTTDGNGTVFSCNFNEVPRELNDVNTIFWDREDETTLTSQPHEGVIKRNINPQHLNGSFFMSQNFNSTSDYAFSHNQNMSEEILQINQSVEDSKKDFNMANLLYRDNTYSFSSSATVENASDMLPLPYNASDHAIQTLPHNTPESTDNNPASAIATVQQLHFPSNSVTTIHQSLPTSTFTYTSADAHQVAPNDAVTVSTQGLLPTDLQQCEVSKIGADDDIFQYEVDGDNFPELFDSDDVNNSIIF